MNQCPEIIRSVPTYKAHSSHDKVINKKIDIFDKISLVWKNDRAKGHYSKSFGDIDVDCSSKKENDDDIEGPSMKRDVQDIKSETSQVKSQKKLFFGYSRCGQ
ncbi:hypothetical protein BC332_18905 [Capsicum chinense]|nr:hypothetical protein BC332_18905 [Capsicum chinense]